MTGSTEEATISEIHRLAVVNRGEAAVRCLDAAVEYRAEHGLDLRTIALYTEPDRAARFVRLADEAVSLGPALYVDPADDRRKHTYLDLDRIERVLGETGADAVWPGWGFVAESAELSARCERLGITFVGPSSEVMGRLGDKIASKLLAEEADVPVVPWSGGAVADVGEARAHAERLGFPLLVKASAGGGGRGIRVVRGEADLSAALDGAQNEARLAFGDERVFLEQMVTGARHVEVQIVADGQGGAWALGVRDCSVQRRNQKVLEESASALLPAAVETALCEGARRLCLAAGYRNAGTVEFLCLPDGRFLFMEVNARLQVEHPVTELTTGADVVKLQLHVARGGRLVGEPPPSQGHAVEVRLNAEDPEADFAPAPGRLAVFRPAVGPGVRVDTGVSEGDSIAPEFDSMVAKLLAWGRDRPEALARLRRALAQTSVVVEGGTTNKAFLLSLLEHPDIVAGPVDTGWLDRMGVDAAPARERHAGLALLMAAVESYDLEGSYDQAQFFAAALRGRPEVRDEQGRKFELGHRGAVYAVEVFRLGRHAYRVVVDGKHFDVVVDHLGTHERRITAAGRGHLALVVTRGGVHAVEIDGVPHTIVRDEGGTVRADAPGIVVSIAVRPGDEVEVGDALLVLESMKMEVTVTAPVAGRVRSVDTAANVQVLAGAALVTLEPAEPTLEVSSTGIDLELEPALPLDDGPAARCARVFDALRSQILGYDVDPEDPNRASRDASILCDASEPDDPMLLECEEDVLSLFADLCSLSRRQPDPDADEHARSAQEYLWTYLRSPERGSEDVPPEFLDRLRRALTHYGISSVDRTAELEEALYWMFRSVQHLGDHAPAIESILDRRLTHADVLVARADDEFRAVLDQLVAAADGRYQTVCDLARDVRYVCYDRPLLARATAVTYDEMHEHLTALAAGGDPEERDRRIQALVECPLALHSRLVGWLEHAGEPMRAVAVEVLARRYYRIRELRDVQTVTVDGWPVIVADYPHEGSTIRLLATGTSADRLPDALERISKLLRDMPADREIVVDCYLEAPLRARAEVAEAQARAALEATGFERPLRRVVVSVGHPPSGPIATTSDCFTFRQHDGEFREETLYRNLHPMLAKRMELWRLDEFDVERTPSPEDVFLFRGVAKENPRDERLFALVEVRDLTPVRDATGRIVALPYLERQFTEALAAIRWLQAHRGRRRLAWNRVLLFVHPPWDVTPDEWRDIAHRLAPSARGLGIEKVVVSLREVRGEGEAPVDRIVELTAPGERGLVIRYRERSDRPIRPLSEYRQRVALTRRRGHTYPYELIEMLTPGSDPSIDSPFPPGEFTELDLDDTGELVEVTRPPGENSANVVVGLLRSFTDKHPEGMERVVLLGDPSRSLGSLAEPECRRIVAALDAAERRNVPLEWFALSAGAKISMDSGTENMDWIAAVLRRIIEFTQRGGELNVVVTGVNVGAQPYWNAEATMLMHTRGILVMLPESAMVLTGKQALDYSGGVSAEDNLGIGGYQRVMGPNGQAQYWAPDLERACQLLLRHYEHSYVAAGERFPRRAVTRDPVDRDVRTFPHARVEGTDFATVGEVFDERQNPERKRPFDIRSVMRAVTDQDHEPLERWERMYGAETSVVWDAHVGGIPVCLLGFESHPLRRYRFIPADGPTSWTSGTLFPQSSKKTARAVNAASGNRPLVVLANLSGFDGSPESMRTLQLEFGAEIGRAVTNFVGPIVFCVVSRYHGGAFVVFSKHLNDQMEIAAVEGSYASVIGGAPAAAVVFAREVDARTDADPRVLDARARLDASSSDGSASLRRELDELRAAVRAEKLGEVANEFDDTHSVHRALRVGSIDRIIAPETLRPYLIDALERGMERERARVAEGPAR